MRNNRLPSKSSATFIIYLEVKKKVWYVYIVFIYLAFLSAKNKIAHSQYNSSTYWECGIRISQKPLRHTPNNPHFPLAVNQNSGREKKKKKLFPLLARDTGVDCSDTCTTPTILPHTITLRNETNTNRHCTHAKCPKVWHFHLISIRYIHSF